MGGRKVLREAGSVTIEFVLVVPLVMLVLIGVLEVIGVAKSRIELEAAAREGAHNPLSHYREIQSLIVTLRT